MIELRWCVNPDRTDRLQYRSLIPHLIATGDIVLSNHWAEWTDVGTVFQEDERDKPTKTTGS